MDQLLTIVIYVLGAYSVGMLVFTYFNLKRLNILADKSLKSIVGEEVPQDEFPREVSRSFLAFSGDLNRVPSNFLQHKAMQSDLLNKAFTYPESRK